MQPKEGGRVFVWARLIDNQYIDDRLYANLPGLARTSLRRVVPSPVASEHQLDPHSEYPETRVVDLVGFLACVVLPQISGRAPLATRLPTLGL